MRPKRAILPLAAALSLVACQDDGPVASNLVIPPENMVGDRSASGLAAPGNAAAAEAADRSALPMSMGMAWTLAPDARSARYGPEGAPAILTLACLPAAGLEVARHHPTDPGASGTISFTGSGHAASIPVAGRATSGGPGRAEWHGSATGDNARAIERSFKATGQVEISIGGAPSLVVPADAAIRDLLRRCLTGEDGPRA